MSAVRVMVLDAWEEVTIPWRADLAVGELKSAALIAARVSAPADEFLVKAVGAVVSDESISLSSAGIAADEAVIVMRRRRQAVR